jgi:prostaglandin-endoperoxide synthase 2
MSLVDAVLRIAWRIPFLSRLVNRYAIDYFATRIPPRPRAYSLWSPEPKPPDPASGPITDYTSWPSLTDKRYSGRHLRPADPGYTSGLPYDAPYKQGASGDVTSLFERKGAMKPDRSSLLFMFFAQWFTDSVLRIDPLDRRKNTSNHDIDLCQIYGLDEATARLLRSMEGGKLRSQRIGNEEYLDYLCEPDGPDGFKVRDRYNGTTIESRLPYAGKLDIMLDGFPMDRRAKLYATGLERGNSSVGYVAISTVFMREHNRICDELRKRNPSWGDERLFQTARNINIVLLLKLVVEDYINHILGHRLFRLDPSFAEERHWYRANWIALEFDLLYRWHGLAPDEITVAGRALKPQDFRYNNALLESVEIGTIIESASSQPAGRIGLFNTPKYLWLAEYNSLKMSRDFRLRPYNDYRALFGLNRLRHFGELTRDDQVRQRLETLYNKDIDKLEYLVGLFAEDPDPGLLFGNLLNRMVAYDAFTQIFSNPLLSRNVYNTDTFTQYGLDLIEETTSVQMLVDRNVGKKVNASLAVRRPEGKN